MVTVKLLPSTPLLSTTLRLLSVTDSSSLTLTLPTVTTGGSTGPSTETVNTAELLLVTSLSSSVDIAVAVRFMSPLKSAGGVTVKSAKSLRSLPSIVQVPLPLSVPSERVAPVGTPEMVTLRVSEPSVSVRAAVIETPIASPSSPSPPVAEIVVSSATPTTLTGTSTCVVPPSVDVASIVRLKSTFEFAGGVRLSSPTRSRLA